MVLCGSLLVEDVVQQVRISWQNKSGLLHYYNCDFNPTKILPLLPQNTHRAKKKQHEIEILLS